MPMTITSLLLALLPAAVPPPPGQVHANCTAPVYATDHLVCQDEALLQLDRQMAALLEQQTPSSAMSGGRWLESQDAWFRRRSLCASRTDHRACAEAAYRERLQVLATVLQPVPDHARRYDCGIEVSAYLDDAGTLSLYVDGQLEGVALPEQRRAAWLSFARFSTRGSTARVHVDGHEPLRCKAGH